MHASVFSGEFLVKHDAFPLKSKYGYQSDRTGFIVWWLLWLDDALGSDELRTRSTSRCLVGVNGKIPTLSEVSGLAASCRIRGSSFSEKENKEEKL